MTVDDVRRLFVYSAWANRKLFQVIEQMAPDTGKVGDDRNAVPAQVIGGTEA